MRLGSDPMGMKCVILPGGRGTRVSEESHLRPKPMIEIGPRPILWHVMKLYAHHGVNSTTDRIVVMVTLVPRFCTARIPSYC